MHHSLITSCVLFLLLFFFFSLSRVLHAVELLAIPMVEEVGEPVTQGNISFTARVYGLPLKKIRACINIDGVRRKGKCVPRFGPADIVNTDMGTFNSSRVYFTWSYGHMDRGNLFGKATWTVSGHSSHKLFPLAKFILRVRNGKRVKKFVFNSEGRDQARFCRCIKDYSSDLGELRGCFTVLHHSKSNFFNTLHPLLIKLWLANC